MDAVALTRTLLQFDTINPPGRERDCARHAGAMLQEWGYQVEYHEYADSRTSVIETAGDRLYGRGSSDMKAGVAAILVAARTMANKLSGTPGVVLVLTAAEEGG